MSLLHHLSRRTVVGVLGLFWAGCAMAPMGWMGSRVEGSLTVVNVSKAAAAGPFVVYLDSESPGIPARFERAVRVVHDGRAFTPTFSVLGEGERLEFENRSKLHHQLFWIDSEGRGKLSLTPKSSAPKRLRIAESGIRRFYCALHPEEHFSVFVTPTPYYAVLRGGEHYVFDAVGLGSWQLRVWSETVEGLVADFEVLALQPQVQDIRIDAARIVKR